MQKVIWSDHAKFSLAAIYDYIFEDSPQNADKVFNTLIDLGNSLANEKVDYTIDPFINNNKYRFISKWSYKIIYERKDNNVRVIDVFGTHQHPNILKSYR